MTSTRPGRSSLRSMVMPRHVKLKVKWLMDVDLLMKDLSDLAAINEELYCEVYNDSTLSKIKSFFPIKIHTEM